MPSPLKSILSVLAGFLTVAVLSVATDAIVEAAGLLPPASQPEAYVWWMYVIALAYRTVWAILGGYVAARLAPKKIDVHVMTLGILGTIGGIAGIFAGWEFGHQWYPILLAVLAYPSVWYGGKLYKKA